MFLVISYWEVLPGREAEFERIRPIMADIMRRQPGVEFIEGMKSGNQMIAIHGYRDEAAYNAIVNNPSGEFAKALETHRLEDTARWIRSERGEAFPR